MQCKNIDHDKKIIFLHPNRCGGKSIELSLFNRSPEKGSADHNGPEKYVDTFGLDVWNNYYKFGFCRNPWDKIVSLFFYRKNNQKKEFVFKSLSDYLLNGEERYPYDFKLQKKYFTYEGKKIDFIGRFENYHKDFNTLTKKLNLNIILPHVNQSIGKMYYKDMFDKKTKLLVEEKFYDDIKYFEYSFD